MDSYDLFADMPLTEEEKQFIKDFENALDVTLGKIANDQITPIEMIIKQQEAENTPIDALIKQAEAEEGMAR